MRTKSAQHRVTQIDPKYQSIAIAKLINRSMRDGKRSVAQKHVYQALETIADQQKKQPAQILDEVLNKISPQMEVRSRRVGGASYQVPMPVRGKRASSLAIRWLILAANKRPNKDYRSFTEKLIAEMTDALAEKGGAINKRNTSHKMAESNKAFSHFRW